MGERTDATMNRMEEERRQTEEELTLMETRISRLRVLYDQYFMGIEKLEPRTLRNELDKMFMRSDMNKVRSTVLKFRYRSLLQRYTSLRSYWDRLVRLIDEGRIRRGVNGRAELGTGTFKTPPDQEGTPQPAPPSAGDKTPAEPALIKRGAVFDPGDIDGIFQALVKARTEAGEPVDKLSRESLAASIGKIAGAGGELSIRVSTKDDKVTLQAVRKREGGGDD